MIKTVFVGVCLFTAGLAAGGYLFSDTQPRSFLALSNCANRCFDPSELAGLLSSAGIQKASGFIPKVIKETDKTVLMEHPFPGAANWTATLALEKGSPTTYPVPYLKWTPLPSARTRGGDAIPPANRGEYEARRRG